MKVNTIDLTDFEDVFYNNLDEDYCDVCFLVDDNLYNMSLTTFKQ